MIFYVVTGTHYYTVGPYFKLYRDSFPVLPQVLFYEELSTLRSFLPGTYIFADVERLTPGQAETAAQIWCKLADAGPVVRLLNHPTRSMRRYQLLRTLYERGINMFNAYSLVEERLPTRFPVFIRREDDHGGNLTTLIQSPAELQIALDTLDQQGLAREDKLIIELCDTADSDGIIRKYSAFIMGDQIWSDHLFFSQHWMIKATPDLKPLPPELQAEVHTYLDTNPHEQELRKICRIANIQYGRVDYGIKDGKLQIWEINTNPSMPMNKLAHVGGYTPVIQKIVARYNIEFAALDTATRLKTTIPNPCYERQTHRFSFKLLQMLPRRYRPYIKHQIRAWQRNDLPILRRKKKQ